MPKKSARKTPPRTKAKAKAARPKRPSRPASRRPAPKARRTAPAPRSQPAEVEHFEKPAYEGPKKDVPRLPSGEPAGRTFPIELNSEEIEATVARMREELTHWAKKGRYTKVRFKFRGKQLLPDLPLAAVMAAEGLTFYWGGILRALIFNLAGKTVFDVELVNDSEKKVQAGREALLSGDADKALACFREALDMDRDSANAYLNLGIVLKLKGDFPAARAALEKAKALDPEGPFGAEAEKILATLPRPATPAVVTVEPPRSL